MSTEHKTCEEQLAEALEAAKEHLDYTGYGDRWERECAKEAGLEGQIDAALARYKKEHKS